MSRAFEEEGDFEQRLRSAREARELSQTELGQKSNLQPAAIGHFEAGRRKPSFANIRALAAALGVSSDYLLGQASAMSGATTAFRNEDKLSAADREFIQDMIYARTKRKEDKFDV